MRTEADIVVVGAGLAGLSAACALVAAGREVIVLEARDRVGGRLYDRPIDGGSAEAVVELGGQWIGPRHQRLRALARELGVTTFPTHTEGDSLFSRGGRVRRYRGTIPRISPAVLADVGRAMARLNRMARRIDPAAPWSGPRARIYDSQTMATWMHRAMLTRRGRELMQIAVEGVWAADPSELSLLHVLFYISSAGGLEALTDTEGGAQQDRFVGGPQQLAAGLAARLGDRIVLQAPVRAIEHDASAGVTLTVGDGRRFRARRTIVAVPVPLTARIAYDPPLPHARDALTQRMAMGTVVKAHAIYDEPFWRADGLSGIATRAEGPIKLVYDNSPPDGSCGVLLAFFEGRHAQQATAQTEAERREAVLRTLASLFGRRALSPRAYVDHAWGQDQYTRGCYGAYLPPGGWTGFGAALRAPVGPIHWAGAESAAISNGYMEGAVRSGQDAAREVLEALER